MDWESRRAKSYFAELIGYKIEQRKSVSTSMQQTTHTKAENREWKIEPADSIGRERIRSCCCRLV